MSVLVACGGEGKAAESYLRKLADAEPWERTFLIAETKPEGSWTHIPIRDEMLLGDMAEAIKTALDGKVPDTEVALNMVVGPGKVHMAALAAILKCGLGVHLVALTPEGMKEL